MPATSPTWPSTLWTRAASSPPRPAALRGTELLLEKRRPLQRPLVRKLQLLQNAWMFRITGQFASIFRERDSSLPRIRGQPWLIHKDPVAAEGPAAGEE